jgi:hypothetical protein
MRLMTWRSLSINPYRKSPPSVAVTASISGEAPIATCTGNAEIRRRPGGEARPPCRRVMEVQALDRARIMNDLQCECSL